MQEQEQNQTVEKVKLPTKVTLTIRVLVGGYLLYTAYSLIDAFKTNTGKEQLFFGVFMLLFVVCGIFLVVHGVRGLINGKYPKLDIELILTILAPSNIGISC